MILYKSISPATFPNVAFFSSSWYPVVAYGQLASVLLSGAGFFYFVESIFDLGCLRLAVQGDCRNVPRLLDTPLQHDGKK
jgi:hypothetical protein